MVLSRVVTTIAAVCAEVHVYSRGRTIVSLHRLGAKGITQADVLSALPPPLAACQRVTVEQILDGSAAYIDIEQGLLLTGYSNRFMRIRLGTEGKSNDE
jgi:hypothetical protein